MGTRLLKLTAVVLTMLMVVSILGACRKEDEEGIQATGSTVKSTTVSKTTAKATVQTGTNVKSTAAAATAAMTTGISGAVSDTASANQSGQASLNDEDAPQQETSGNSGETVINETFVNEDIDLGGRTVLIGGWATWVRDMYIDKEGNPAVCRIVDRRLKAAEEKYNFKRGYNIPSGGSNVFKNEVVTKTMAGVKFADIVRTAASYDFASWVTQKIMLPLDEYIDYEAPIIKTNAVMYYGSLWKGRHYGIAESAESTNIFLMYNRALLEREGQRDILDLVEEKLWNWNAFLDMCKSVTKDLNGDGIIDQWGVGTQTTWYFIKYLLYSNGMTCGVSIDKDDNIQLILKSGPAIRAMQFASDLSFVHKVYISEKAVGGVIPSYLNGQTAIFINNTANAPNKLCLNNGMQSYCAPLPMGPDVDDYTNINTSGFFFISSLCEKPEEVTKIWAEVNLLWDENLKPIPELAELVRTTVPAEFEWSPGNPNRYISTEREYILNYVNQWPRYRMDFTDSFPNLTTNISNLIGTPILNGTKSVTQAIDSAESVLQSLIDPYK